MGTNFYLFTQTKEYAETYAPHTYKIVDEPKLGYKIHIAKTSAGWLPIFQAHKGGIDSVAKLKEAFSTGYFEIYDEYNAPYDWKKFRDRVLEFNGGVVGVEEPTLMHGIDGTEQWSPISHVPGTKQSYSYMFESETESFYKDPEGYEFDKREFE